jgi:hypothetical protein
MPTTVTNPTTQRRWAVTTFIDSTDMGTFEGKSGGASDSEETTYILGAMGERISLGGSKTPENVTVNRIYDLSRDHAKTQWLEDRVSWATMEVHQQPLDSRKRAWGQAVIYKGTFKRYKIPDVDSQGNDPALLELEMTVATIQGMST